MLITAESRNLYALLAVTGRHQLTNCDTNRGPLMVEKKVFGNLSNQA